MPVTGTGMARHIFILYVHGYSFRGCEFDDGNDGDPGQLRSTCRDVFVRSVVSGSSLAKMINLPSRFHDFRSCLESWTRSNEMCMHFVVLSKTGCHDNFKIFGETQKPVLPLEWYLSIPCSTKPEATLPCLRYEQRDRADYLVFHLMTGTK